MLTRIIGDIHGLFTDYRTYSIGTFTGPTIQIGDFGLGFGQSEYWLNNVKDHQSDRTHRFIRGNHDNPAICKTMPGFINDGNIENDVMFIGGAWSIDNPKAPPGWYKRTKNYDWWEDEELSDAEFEAIFSIYSFIKPKILITHECPSSIAKRMFFDSGFIKGPQYPTRTGTALQRMYEAHQPNIHIFGHYHNTMLHIENNTYFMCLNELDYIDLDLEDIDQMQQAMVEKIS